VGLNRIRRHVALHRIFSLDADRSKTKRPAGSDHFNGFESIPEDGKLFPARGNDGTTFSGWSKSKERLDALCRIEPWTLHDLRRTFATQLASLATPPHIVERLLNHASGKISGVAAVYNRFQYMDEMRVALERWEAKLTRLLQS
jgi:integrase